MRFRPGLQRRLSIPFAVLLAGLIVAPGVATAGSVTAVGRGSRQIQATALARSAGSDAALTADGRFVGGPGITGSIDASAWTLVSDLAAGEPPRFALAVAVATPIGPWSALGSNGSGNGALNNQVNAVAVSGTDLYVGGNFTNAAGVATADYIAKWNGTAWSGVGSNGFGDGAIFGAVDAIAVSGGNVYVGGTTFTNVAGLAAADYVAKWNGSAWSALGSNGSGNGAIVGTVNAIAVSGSNVYVGGNFANAAGIPEADYVAKWNGSAWSALGSNGSGNGTLNAAVRALAVSGSDVYVGGTFVNVSGLGAAIPEADYVAKWNGSAWSALGSNGSGNGAINSYVTALTVAGSDVYVGGWFTNAAGIAAADYVAKWNGSSWAPLGSDGTGDGAIKAIVNAIAVAGSDVYVGGTFFNAAGIPEADAVAKWNGSAWSALGSNGAGNGALFYIAYGLAASGTNLYTGGNFIDAAGIVTADYVASWYLVPFTDIASSPFKSDIEWVYLAGIASGCSLTLYCPDGYVTRAQMASFLARALHLSGSAPDAFTDDNGNIHEPNINLVAKAGIATGCGGTKFCPDGLVSRDQMASFLARALHLSGSAPDAFTDDNGNIHEPNINLVAKAGIATGCGGTKYCPLADVTRGQMAAFLHRAFGP